MKMRPAVPEFDFVARRRAPGWLGWLVLAIGLAAAFGAVRQYQQLETDVEALQESNRRAARAAEQARVLARLEQDDVELRARLDVARKLSASMARDWPALFADLEARGEDVALLSLEPDAGRRVLRLTGEAKDLNALFAYAESFADAKVTGSPRIEVFELRERQGMKVVAFSMRLKWSGA
ncbi:MAG: hypothetical protein KKD25_00600 [Gammaproteobacteria bacterium]|jgi:hypothetical protein|nr:hypothetical protein [Gammaproteobacteria bacterium]MBU0773560.1 hypothetical protein [Gammaproteobacteria bacterium]MBU0857676.1 hypothetical protein [Gammaproteobacteria bacterium]MBU1848092.1 hypothetical protein [Gammaproteobacteria bacterium]